jgi:hypothetical protein
VPCSSSFDDAVVLTAVADVVAVVFLRLCARRFVVGIAIEPPDPFVNALFTDGMAVVEPPDGRTGVSALTFEAIHAK